MSLFDIITLNTIKHRLELCIVTFEIYENF